MPRAPKQIAERRTKGTGSKVMYDPKTDTYKCYVTDGVNWNGSPKRRYFTGKTREEVDKKRNAFLYEKEKQMYIEPQKITLGQWMDEWLSDYSADLAPTTKERYRLEIEKHIKPNLGGVKLQALDERMIQRTIKNLSQSMQPKSVKMFHGVLHAALGRAVINNMIVKNPAAHCVLPTIQRKEVQPLPDAVFHEIKGHKYESVYLAGFYLGARRAELLGLTWDCIDFDRGVVIIKQQLQGNEIRETTKGKKSRVIVAPPDCMELFKAEKKKQAAKRLKAGNLWENALNLVFTNDIGRPLIPNHVSDDFKTICKHAGFPEGHFHSIRHTYETYMLENGEGLKTIQDNMGHSDINMTLNVYAHVSDSMKKTAAKNLNDTINSKLKNA